MMGVESIGTARLLVSKIIILLSHKVVATMEVKVKYVRNKIENKYISLWCYWLPRHLL